jgi:predicted ATPase/class 3 adenylate cyclase
MPIVCTKCNFNNPPGMRFCGMCGTPLSKAVSKEISLTDTITPEKPVSALSSDLLELLQITDTETSQRRNVTLLFTDLAGYTAMSVKMDTEEVYHIIQEYSRLLADSVYKYDGTIDKFTGDGLMAIFGAPIAQENNAEMAIRAALDMQEGLDKANIEIRNRHGIELQMRVGLNYGPVIVGSVGSETRMEYTAIGNTVNMASRLEQATKPMTILASESVYHQTKALFNFELIPPLTLKGIPIPVQAFRVINAKHKPGAVRGLEGLRSEMIGRKAEVTQIKKQLNTLVTTNQGGFILITGEAGLGKSRLVTEFKALIRRDQAQILEGNSLHYRRSVSYWIFRDIFTHFLDISADLSESEVHNHLLKIAQMLLGEQANDVLPYLEYMMALRPFDQEATRRLSLLEPDQLRQRIFLAVRDIFIAEAKSRPLIVILEDLHWADDASLDLISFLIDSLNEAPILLCGVSRPSEHEKLIQMVERGKQRLHGQFTYIQLQNLTLKQSKNLFQRLLPIPDIPEDLLQVILNRAAGIPFYLEEMIRMLIEGNMVQQKGVRWQMAPGASITSIGIPDNLQGLILARFDNLPSLHRKTLQVAAAIGKRFNLSLLKMVMEIPEDRGFTETINQIVEREFILPESDLPGAEYIFKYALVAETIYSTLLHSDRTELHGKIGAAVEQLFADRLDEYIELLARHYAWSTKYDRALHYLLLAGKKATRSYINDQALQHYQQALECLPKTKHTVYQELQVLIGLGDVLVLTGDYNAARKNFQSTSQLLDLLDPNQHIVERSSVLRKIARTYEREGKYDHALLYLGDAQKFLQAASIRVPVEMSKTLSDTGWIFFRRGDLETAELNLTHSLELAEDTTQYDLIASIYNRLGGIYFQSDNLEKASEYVRKSLELRDMLGDIIAVARSYNNLGLLDWKMGKWNNALENFIRSIELNEKLGDI